MHMSPLEMQRRIVCLISVLMLVVTGCGGQSLQERAVEEASETPLSSTSPLAIWHDDKITFMDPALEIALDFPGDWNVYQSNASKSRMVFYSPCMNNAPDVLPPCTMVEISLRSPQGQSFEEVRDAATSHGIPILEEQRLDLHGLTALWIKTGHVVENDTLSVIQTYVFTGTNVVQLYGYGELEPVGDIVRSIRPITEEGVCQ